jgi:hypothetical protein
MWLSTHWAVSKGLLVDDVEVLDVDAERLLLFRPVDIDCVIFDV